MVLPALDFDVLEEEKCCSCSVRFALPSSLRAARLSDGKMFYCPNGHSQFFTKSYKKLLEEAKAALASEKAERWRQAGKAQAAERRLFCVKERLKAGNCPKCSAVFPDLDSHIKKAHPRLRLDRGVHLPQKPRKAK